MQFESRKQDPPKILIVQDELTVAEHTRNILENLNFEITGITRSGESAIELAQKHTPDLILMDVRLRGRLDGIETARQILKHISVPVIYITAYTDDQLLKRAQQTDPFGYLLKRFDIKDIHSAIEIALHKHKAEAWLCISKHFLEIANSGSGLGLYIAKAFTKLRKGNILVDTERTSGSRFKFHIPLAIGKP